MNPIIVVAVLTLSTQCLGEKFLARPTRVLDHINDQLKGNFSFLKSMSSSATANNDQEVAEDLLNLHAEYIKKNHPKNGPNSQLLLNFNAVQIDEQGVLTVVTNKLQVNQETLKNKYKLEAGGLDVSDYHDLHRYLGALAQEYHRGLSSTYPSIQLIPLVKGPCFERKAGIVVASNGKEGLEGLGVVFVDYSSDTLKKILEKE